MSSELEKLKLELAEANRALAESDRARAESDRARAESDRARAESDRALAESDRVREEQKGHLQPTTIRECLAHYHQKSIALAPVDDPAALTRGELTNPEGRKYPKRIIPWDEFPSKQQLIWETIRASSVYSSRLFEPIGYISRVKLVPVRSEEALRFNETNTVGGPTADIINKILADEQLKRHFGLSGEVVKFLDFKNLGVGTGIDTSMENLSLLTPERTPAPDRRGAQAKGKTIPHHRGPADAFFVCEKADGQEKVGYEIEYKPRFKMILSAITAGLQGEIQPDRDVIGKDCEGFIAESRWLVAAVITQLYSSLIRDQFQYGYISTGEAIIFLFITPDPEIVKYHLCIPHLDVEIDDPTTLHHTAVAQVVAFSLQALAAKKIPQSWHAITACLNTWAAVREALDSPLPASIEKERESPAYKTVKAPKFGYFLTERITRSKSRINEIKAEDTTNSSEKKDAFTLNRPRPSRCRPESSKTNHSGDSDDNDKRDPSPTPAPSLSRATGPNAGKADHGAAKSTKGNAGGRGGEAGGRGGDARKRVEEREYCSGPCLLGLAHGGPLDPHCPNIADHGKKHIKRATFLRLVRAQMARDRGEVTNCEELWISGSRGAMLKITLTTRGYTVIAKGVQQRDVPHLLNEAEVYHQLRSIQGTSIPVCLGNIHLIHPYYYMSSVFVCLLLLSFAGVSIRQRMNAANKAEYLSKITSAMESIHKLRVLHCDPFPRNILCDESGAVQFVDFERSKIQMKEPKVKTLDKRRKRPANKKTRVPDVAKVGMDGQENQHQLVEEIPAMAINVKDTDFAKELRAAIRYAASRSIFT